MGEVDEEEEEGEVDEEEEEGGGWSGGEGWLLTHSELLHVTCDLFPDLAVIL